VSWLDNHKLGGGGRFADITVSCANCGNELEEDIRDPAMAGRPCPHCGDTHREVEINVVDTIRVIDQLETTIHEHGVKDWSKRMVQGEEYFRKDDEIHTIVRVMDRKNRYEPDSYYEFITKTETGDLVRSVSERFVDHVGRGSAKHTIPEFPHEWVAVCAYYIWEKGRRPNGRHINHWNKAKSELKKMWKAGQIRL